MTLIELRDALAKAAGPSRELDGRLFAHLGGEKFQNAWWDAKATSPRGSSDKSVSDKTRGYAPRYTASIDAAVTLLEPWMEYTLSTLYGVADFECPLNAGDAGVQSFSVRRKDGNAVLAICQWRVEYEIAKAGGAS